MCLYWCACVYRYDVTPVYCIHRCNNYQKSPFFACSYSSLSLEISIQIILYPVLRIFLSPNVCYTNKLLSVLKLVVIFMDEPTGGLDVSVQARLLDLIRSLVGPNLLSHTNAAPSPNNVHYFLCKNLIVEA